MYQFLLIVLYRGCTFLLLLCECGFYVLWIWETTVFSEGNVFILLLLCDHSQRLLRTTDLGDQCVLGGWYLYSSHPVWPFTAAAAYCASGEIDVFSMRDVFTLLLPCDILLRPPSCVDLGDWCVLRGGCLYSAPPVWPSTSAATYGGSRGSMCSWGGEGMLLFVDTCFSLCFLQTWSLVLP